MSDRDARGSYTPREFQRRHNISKATFYRMIARGDLKVVYPSPRSPRVPALEDARFSALRR